MLFTVLGAFISWWVTDNYWHQKWTAQKLETAKAQVAQQQSMRRMEKVSSTTLAKIDHSQYQELQNAQKDIADLRNAVSSGTRRLQQCQQQANRNGNQSGQFTRMGDNGQTVNAASTGQTEQDILDLGEYAVTAIKQRDACVDAYQQTQQILNH